MVKKLKDLGGEKYKKFSSISTAQKAGSIYYGKKLKSGKIKKMAAVLTSDLGKGQSLNSFMNKQLKSSSAAGMKPVVDPKRRNVGTDYYTNPEKIGGISRADMLKIIDGSKPKIVRSSETKTQRVKRISAQAAGVTTVARLRAILKDAGATPAIIAETLKDPVILKRLEKQKTIQDSAIAQERGGRESAMIKRPANKSEVILESFSAVKPTIKKPNRTVAKNRKMSNAAVVKFFKKMYPSKLANIKIGDTISFDPIRENSDGNPAILMIRKKG